MYRSELGLQVFGFDNTQTFHLVDSHLFDIYLESSGRCWWCFIGYSTTVSLTRWLQQHTCDISENGSEGVFRVGSFCGLWGAFLSPFSTLLYPTHCIAWFVGGISTVSVNTFSLFIRTLATLMTSHGLDHLWWPYFQVRSHSQDLIKTSLTFQEDIVQPPTEFLRIFLLLGSSFWDKILSSTLAS